MQNLIAEVTQSQVDAAVKASRQGVSPKKLDALLDASNNTLKERARTKFTLPSHE